jgi:uncharacterized protein
MESAVANHPPLRSAWIAPRWHMVMVVLAILGFSALAALGAHQQAIHPAVQPQKLAVGYTFAIVMEWLMTALVWFGIRRRNVRLRELVGGRWQNLPAVLRDLGVAALFFLASNLVSALLVRFLKIDPLGAVRAFLPHNRTETALYLLMALTAGICEEIIFRAYLLKQFTAMMRNAGVAVALQGILFAVFHGNQGWRFMVIIAMDGWLLGALAYWRRSVRPGMIAHSAQDGIVGLLSPWIFR